VRKLVLVLALAILSSCTLQGTASHPAATPSKSAISTPTPKPILHAAIVVGSSGVDPALQIISLVATDGHVITSTRAATRTKLSQHSGVYFPSVSTSDQRVYYLDGDTEVKSLDPDGSTRHATQVPGGPNAYAVFAVSPDERRIAISVFDYSAHPVRLRLYVEDLEGGHNHADIFVSDVLYVWPLGWHDRKLVLQVGSPFHGSGSLYTPYGDLPQSFHVVDSATADRLATLGSPGCQPMGSLLSPAGAVCRSSSGISTVDWNGASVEFAKGLFTGGAALSPDGTRVAACCFNGPGMAIISSPATGSHEAMTAAAGYPDDGGWIDDNHVCFRGAGSPNLQVLDVQSNAVAPMQAPGILQARLPGSL
jgi:hypothetical protein